MRRPATSLKVFRHERGGGEGEGALFLVGANPGRGKHVVQQRHGRQARAASRSRCGAQPAKVADAIGRDADELEALGKDLAVAGFDLVGEQEEQMRLVAVVGRVHEDGALAQEVAVLFQQHVADGEHERVAGMKHAGEGSAGLVQRADGFLGEADALVALEHGSEFAAVAAGDEAVALADRGRNVGDLEAVGLARINGTAQRLEGFHEEGADEVGLEAAGLGLFHLFLHRKEAFGAHGLSCARALRSRMSRSVSWSKAFSMRWPSRARTSGWSP